MYLILNYYLNRIKVFVSQNLHDFFNPRFPNLKITTKVRKGMQN